MGGRCGYSPFTLAAEISALLAAAEIAELTGRSDQAQTLRDAADAWNDNIERWVYATGGDLAQQLESRDIMSVSRHQLPTPPPRRRKVLSPSRIAHRGREWSALITSSARMHWLWCALGCGLRTILAF